MEVVILVLYFRRMMTKTKMFLQEVHILIYDDLYLVNILQQYHRHSKL